MRTKSIIALLLFAIMFVMADTKIPFFQKKKENIQVVSDSKRFDHARFVGQRRR